MRRLPGRDAPRGYSSYSKCWRLDSVNHAERIGREVSPARPPGARARLPLVSRR
jgi:hypothetical protein